MSRTSHHNPRYAQGSFGLSYHLEMISDRERVGQCKSAIRQALEACGPDSVFCELGCGTGIFSIYASQFCRKVYAVEADPVVRAVAQQNVDRLGLGDRIEILAGDARDVDLPTQGIDVLFCEMMSVWLITEPQVSVIRRWLDATNSNIRFVIPSKVINLAELGQVDYEFDGLRIKGSLPQFSGIRPPRIMTESRVVSEIVLDRVSSLVETVERKVEMESLVSGDLNCARLSSIVEFFPGVTFFSTDTLMPTTIVPLESTVEVSAGDLVEFEVSYRHRSELEEASFRASRRMAL